MSMRRFWLRCREGCREGSDDRCRKRGDDRGVHKLQNELHKAQIKVAKQRRK